MIGFESCALLSVVNERTMENLCASLARRCIVLPNVIPESSLGSRQSSSGCRPAPHLGVECLVLRWPAVLEQKHDALVPGQATRLFDNLLRAEQVRQRQAAQPPNFPPRETRAGSNGWLSAPAYQRIRKTHTHPTPGQSFPNRLTRRLASGRLFPLVGRTKLPESCHCR
ncbi:MAG: hypothetical protein CM1200mP29_13800 [Verrucomicrobiota bacterium]|nr:MAG: hypothetical protein CM1200mP29_13800 [Verrucomicrobiota bacterium]